MTTPFDAAQDLADAPRVTQGQRPRDAATLILLDGDRVLMGRRAPGHVFMPSKWVFPGGRLDRADFTAEASSLLRPEPSEGCGELDEIAWLSLDEAERLDLPAITRFVLGEVRARRADPDLPPPFVRMVRGRHLVTRA